MRERTDPTKIAMLRRIPALRSASDGTIEQVAAAVDVLDVAAGQRLTVEGQAGRVVYLVVDGRATVERTGAPVAAIGAGDVVADLVPITGSVRGATVRAVTPMRVLVAGPGSLTTLLDGLDAAASAAAARAGSLALPRPGRVRRALRLPAPSAV